MTVDSIVTSPSFIKIKTIENKERFINSNMIVSVSPVEDEEMQSDILMLNGDKYTIKETAGQLMDNRYRRDVNKGASIINFLG